MAWLLLPASTERLRLRRLTDSDLPPFVGYRSCREVARLQSWTEDFGLEQAQALLRSQDSNSWGQPDTWYQTAIADKTTDTLLGDIALHFPPAGSRVLEVGFTVAPEHQGKGYASEALRCVLTAAAEGGEVEKVVAYTDVRNTAARRLLERVGFVQEGEPSEATFKGEVCLEVCYVYVVGSCPRG